MSVEGMPDLSDMDPDDLGETEPNVHMLLKIVILGFIGLVSVVGNGIALGTLLVYNKQLRITIYIVIGGLALADIVVSIMNVPDQIMFQAEKGELKSETWCKFYGLLYNSCQYIAAFHLVVLGVLRGILLTDRAHHGPTAIHALITCAILWVVSLLANIPMISSSVHDPLSKRCVVVFTKNKNPVSLQNEDSSAEERYLILSSAFSYFLPLILIIFIYLFTGYMSKRFFEDSYSFRERRMSKMISSLIVAFALCRLPSETVTILWFYQVKNTDMIQALNNDTDKYKVWIHVREYLQILSMFDMALRPIIYATMSREFGHVYDKVINCTYCKDDDDEDELPPQLHYRGNEIEEVLHTPLRRNPETPECGPDNELEEIF